MMHPIPDAALDDRLGFLGMTGSGKTFGAGTCVERIIAKHGRVIIPDPLGVWWGLRQMADGETPSPFEIVIFGGAHADLPITPHAGAIIGETVAGMRESAIIDLSQFETAASERRFMLAFLDAVYRKASGDPVHVVFDEADMWAPERIVDKEGEATKLHGMMQSIVRRGRIKGLTSWLISQRPAALSKNVLSQVDGLVAFRLTASQDRKALGLWIEGQADREAGKAILGRLPEKTQGEAVVWLPARGILNDVTFPPKRTYDSSRAPKRGEKTRRVDLKPLDVGALRDRLSTVEQEAKANDPKALKAEIAKLRKQVTDAAALAVKTGSTPDPQAIEDARSEAYDEGQSHGFLRGWEKARHAFAELVNVCQPPQEIPRHPDIHGSNKRRWQTKAPAAAPAVKREPTPHTNGALSRPHHKVVEALTFWAALGFDRPTRVQVGMVAGYSPNSGGFNNLLGSLRTASVIDYPVPGHISLTAHGKTFASDPEGGSVQDRAMSVLSGPQRRILSALLKQGGEMSRDELGAVTDYSPTSGGFNNLLGSLRSLGVIDYPSPGIVRAEEWLFT